MEQVLNDICQEIRKARRRGIPKWKCTTSPASLNKDAFAAEAVRSLAEMPLEDYFRDCPEVSADDLAKLQRTLSL